MTIFTIFFLLIGMLFLWGYFFKNRQFNKIKNDFNLNKNRFIIKEIKVCSDNLSKKEQEQEINLILLQYPGFQEIINKAVKDDGFLYITLKINKLDKLKKEKFYYLVAAIVLFGMAFYSATYTVKIGDKYSYLVGKTYNYEIAKELGGETETLRGTNNKIWIAYFPKADITIVEDKRTNIIKKVLKGRE